MKAQELRIGNMVKTKHIAEVVHVRGVSHKAVDVCSDDEDVKVNINSVCGIQLSDEILENWCGFKANSQKGYMMHCGVDTVFRIKCCPYDNSKYFVGIEYTDSPVDEDIDRVYNFKYNVRYIHQLQNLCYDLVGEELKINIKP